MREYGELGRRSQRLGTTTVTCRLQSERNYRGRQCTPPTGNDNRSGRCFRQFPNGRQKCLRWAAQLDNRRRPASLYG